MRGFCLTSKSPALVLSDAKICYEAIWGIRSAARRLDHERGAGDSFADDRFADDRFANE